MQFDIGDKVVVPNHGVGIIKEINSTEFDGEVYRELIIKVLDNGLTKGIPENKLGANGIREVIPPQAVEKVYDVLRDRDTPADKQTWNRRYRDYQSKIATGDPLEVAAVLRDLARLKAEKPLSFGERRMYDQVHSLIVQEVAVARDVEEAVIEEEIAEIFKV